MWHCKDILKIVHDICPTPLLKWSMSNIIDLLFMISSYDNLRPGCFLLLLSDCMLEICMLLAGVRVQEHCRLQSKQLGWSGALLNFFKDI